MTVGMIKWGNARKLLVERYGWGARIRTSECRDQNPVPYHLATPQENADHYADSHAVCQMLLVINFKKNLSVNSNNFCLVDNNL